MRVMKLTSDSIAPTVGPGSTEVGKPRVRLRQGSVRVRESAEAHARGFRQDAGMKVLLVEDEDSIAEPLAEGLRREGFTVELAATGAEALAAGPADVVLLDLRLPDTDGYAVHADLQLRRIWIGVRKNRRISSPIDHPRAYATSMSSASENVECARAITCQSPVIPAGTRKRSK